MKKLHQQVLWVAAGGAVGALLRAFLLEIEPEYFPFSTVIVNIVGCMYLGWVLGKVWQGKLADFHLPFQGTGIAGALTTFSMFSAETARFLEAAVDATGIFMLVLYSFGQIVVGFLVFHYSLQAAEKPSRTQKQVNLN